MSSSDAVVCIVQARMGSSRLPGKVLMELAGHPMLGLLLDRLDRRPAGVVGEVVVATSELVGDDPVADYCLERGTPVVRGPEQDVLGRYLAALDAHPADHVVRITADCPLTDPALVRDVVELHLRRGADYSCNVLPRTFPRGLDVEVVRSAALREAAAESSDSDEREHVTPFVYRRPERFALANLRSGDDLGDLRWTVDTRDDLDLLRAMLAQVPDPVGSGWRDLLATSRAGRHRHDERIRLRPASDGDAAAVLEWRNDPVSVASSTTGRPVAADEHSTWFAARLEDPGCRLSIAEQQGRRIGMVRVEVTAGVGVVSIALDPSMRGRGLGTAVLARAVDELDGSMQVRSLVADVLPDNAASLAAFRHAGFVVQSVEPHLVRLAREV